MKLVMIGEEKSLLENQVGICHNSSLNSQFGLLFFIETIAYWSIVDAMDNFLLIWHRFILRVIIANFLPGSF